MKRRRTTVLALGVIGLLVVPFAVSRSAAAWVDVEHDHGVLGAVDCDVDGFVSAATGRLVSGSVLGTNLDAAVAITGASATNNGTQPSTEVSNPLNLLALGTINAQLGNSLHVDAGAQTGVVRQFARATSWGYSAGSAGAVTDSGSIALQPPAPGAPVPQFASLDLGEVLSAVTGSGLGGGISGLADVRLAIGALASFATLDGCAADWTGDVAANLNRQYLLSGLSAQLDSPLVAGLSTTTIAGLQNIDTLVAAVAGQSGLVNSITSSTVTALSSVLSGFIKGTPITTVTLDVDLSPVQALLATPIADPQGIVSMNLSTGTVTVDLARLLGPSYSSSVGLNGLAPNTELLINAAALAALTAAVDAALIAWVAQVTAAINAALAIVTVDVTVSVPISVGVAALGLTVPVGAVNVTIAHASLASLIAGTAIISTTLALTPPSCAGLTGGIICGVVNPLLATLTSAVTGLVLGGILGPVVGNLIKTALTPVPGLASLLTTLGTTRSSIVSFLSTSLSALFGPDAVLSLIVNAQDTLVPQSAEPFRTGQYSVAALRLVAVGGVGGGVQVTLARSTVGSNGPA